MVGSGAAGLGRRLCSGVLATRCAQAVYPEELAPGKESPITLIQKSRRALDLGEDELELPGFVQVVIFASRIMMKRSESGLSLDELDELDEVRSASPPQVPIPRTAEHQHSALHARRHTILRAGVAVHHRERSEAEPSNHRREHATEDVFAQRRQPRRGPRRRRE